MHGNGVEFDLGSLVRGIESGDGAERWGTVGVSDNVIEASWQALVDSLEYKLFKDRLKKSRKTRTKKG